MPLIGETLGLKRLWETGLDSGSIFFGPQGAAFITWYTHSSGLLVFFDRSKVLKPLGNIFSFVQKQVPNTGPSHLTQLGTHQYAAAVWDEDRKVADQNRLHTSSAAGAREVTSKHLAWGREVRKFARGMVKSWESNFTTLNTASALNFGKWSMPLIPKASTQGK